MKILIGGILFAIGLLIALASGLCSMTMLVSSGFGDITSMLGAVAVFGGIPFAIGVGLCFAGRSLIKTSREEEQSLSRPPIPPAGEE